MLQHERDFEEFLSITFLSGKNQEARLYLKRKERTLLSFKVMLRIPSLSSGLRTNSLD